MTTVALRAADGATAEVQTHGAHVTSWCPAPGGVERLFLSGRSDVADGSAIRGGIPVIFPQFATEGPLPRHGFARTSAWTLVQPPQADRANATAVFELTDSDATRAIWPARFRATLTVRIGGRELATSLAIENTGGEPFDFAAALHTYLRVHDVADAEIVGLHGGRYRESRAPQELIVDQAEYIRVSGEIDRVYVDAPPRLSLRETDRALAVETSGFPDVVIWNPGAAKALAMSDMEPGGERRMICIEAAAVQQRVHLEAARRWSATQTLAAVDRTA